MKTHFKFLSAAYSPENTVSKTQLQKISFIAKMFLKKYKIQGIGGICGDQLIFVVKKTTK